jgi:transposase
MTTHRPYPSDLSDARWTLVEPVLAAWRAARQEKALVITHAPEVELRAVMDAILYVDRTGIPWRYLPHDYPNWNTVYHYFTWWCDDGIFEELSGLLRRLVRTHEGRSAEPSACVIDAQSVKTATSVPTATQGTDANKKIVGRKRHIATDTLGLLLAVLVTAASVQDSTAGKKLLTSVAATHPTITKSWVDGGYNTTVTEHGARLGIDVEVVHRAPGTRGFTVIPRRWVVERSLGWLMTHRRLARDYETLPHHSEAMIQIAMIDNLARRATGETTPTWHDPAPTPETLSTG